MSSPGDTIVHLFDPEGQVYDIDIGAITRDGRFTPLFSQARRLPLEVGWYAGGVHQGTRRDGTFGDYEVAPGYIAQWVEAR